MLQTEFQFTLPLGYLDADGKLHREGTMRLATAADETSPLDDPRVHENPAYWLIILFSRVITNLGTLDVVTTKTIEGLYSADISHIQRLYREVNKTRDNRMPTRCPYCDHAFEIELQPQSGVWRYPVDRLYQEVSYIAYHFHWQYEQICLMEHSERLRWVKEIAKINKQLNEFENTISL